MKNLKHVLFLIAYMTLSNIYGQSPSNAQNYVMESTPRRAYKTIAAMAGKPVDSVNRSIRYLDGLGREVQLVQWQSSPGKKDLVEYKEYDGFGRMSHTYLPYAEQSSANGSFKTAAKANQSNFYKNTGWDAYVNKTDHPYAITVFESSPLNRTREQGAPGTVWQPAASRSTSSGRTVVSAYGTNVATGTEAVKLWSVTSSGASNSSNYAAGKLSRTVSRDENWTSGKAGTIEEYTDHRGLIVLERIWESSSKKLDTYYVYDDYGNLRYVIPPLVTVNSFTDGSAVFADYIYGYRYDSRQRLSEKKVPGRGWEWIVYNRNHQPVMTQDAVQRISNHWTYTKYDAFGQVVGTGIHTGSYATRAAAQTAADSHAASSGKDWEERIATANYTNQSFPTTGLLPLEISYYDDYTFSGASATELQPSGITKSTRTKGLLTGSLIYEDDGSAPLLTVYYYDDRGRMIQSIGWNHLGGLDQQTNTYDFTGQLVSSNRSHRLLPSGPVTTVLTSHTYDHQGRLLDTRKKVDTQAEYIQSRSVYNEIGQLRQKRLHSENNGVGFVASMDYTYNERQWLSRTASGYFTQELKYHLPVSGAAAQYNGNISEQHWGHGSTTPNVFRYTYDVHNRLTDGQSTGTVMREQISYDDMGNILTLRRDAGTTTSYTYSGHRLSSLSGGVSGGYTYDANGNAVSDRQGFAYTYNYLSQPRTVSKTGTSVSYRYDARGGKRRVISVTGSTTVQRDYIQEFEYLDFSSSSPARQLIHTEEGYIQYNASTGVNTAHYYLRDHLGNVRGVLRRTGATTGVVEQQNDYYPFGLLKTIATGGINQYLYNGKELQGELGYYDYGARQYDPVIGRWNVVDPMAENHYSTSPYAYVLNNPLRYMDPLGLDTVDANAFSGYEWVHFDPSEDVMGIQEIVITYSIQKQSPQVRMFQEFGRGLVDATPFVGHSLRGQQKLAAGDYWGGALDYSYAAVDLFTFGLGGKLLTTSASLVQRSVGNFAAKTGLANARALGIAGEEAVGVGSKVRIPSLTGTAKYRIPDQLTSTTLGEVKNVSHLSLTRQLTDFHMFSQQTGRQFILYTRPNTTFSGPLQNLINNGSIITKPIPFK